MIALRKVEVEAGDVVSEALKVEFIDPLLATDRTQPFISNLRQMETIGQMFEALIGYRGSQDEVLQSAVAAVEDIMRKMYREERYEAGIDSELQGFLNRANEKVVSLALYGGDIEM